MDQSLDEIINEQPRNGPRSRQSGPRGGGGGGGRGEGGYRRGGPSRTYDNGPRDGIKKQYSQRDAPRSYRRDAPRDIDSDWVHDKYDDEPEQPYRNPRDSRDGRLSRYDQEAASTPIPSISGRIRVENVHFELGEEELTGLFSRIGPVLDVRMTFDKYDRPLGTAFVTYKYLEDAENAVREFDGANAYAQPIHLTLLHSQAPAAPREAPGASRNPFDHVEKPSRSLFDRIEPSYDAPSRRSEGGNDRAPQRRRRSMSPNDRLAPPGVDRYAPRGARDSRSPMRPRGGGPRESGRRPGARREDSGRRGGRGGRATGEEGRLARDGRPKKTAEELDAEMDGYWGNTSDQTSASAPRISNVQHEPQVAAIQSGENQTTNTTSGYEEMDLMIE